MPEVSIGEIIKEISLFSIIGAILVFLVVYRFRKGVQNLPSDEVMPDKMQRHPGIAAVLSFLVSGLGQFYNGELAKGFKYAIFFATGWFVLIATILEKRPDFFLIGGVCLSVVYLSAVLDAYKSALKINELAATASEANMKQCPYCAEMVKKRAAWCRYCTNILERSDSVSESDKLSTKDWLNEGRNLFKTGNHEEALDAFTKAIELDPNNATAYFARAAAYQKTGDANKTLFDLKSSASLGHETARILLKKKGLSSED